MKAYGLTGGVGMGKSYSEKIIRERGIPALDTDAVARELVEPGKPALAEIQAAFGPDVISADGRLRRDELARRVFGDSDARKLIEQILHPRIRQVWSGQLREWQAQGVPRAVVVIPLLFETNAQEHFHRIICVACTAATQAERLKQRGWSEREIAQRIQAQWPVEKKMELSHFVVWTEADHETHALQLERILP